MSPNGVFYKTIVMIENLTVVRSGNMTEDHCKIGNLKNYTAINGHLKYYIVMIEIKMSLKQETL